MIVSNSLGSIALRRDDEYRDRIMRSKYIQNQNRFTTTKQNIYKYP